MEHSRGGLLFHDLTPCPSPSRGGVTGRGHLVSYLLNYPGFKAGVIDNQSVTGLQSKIVHFSKETQIFKFQILIFK
jgi:hypothetical protein